MRLRQQEKTSVKDGRRKESRTEQTPFLQGLIVEVGTNEPYPHCYGGVCPLYSVRGSPWAPRGLEYVS